MEKNMEVQNERFDSVVREKLTGYEPEVPHAIWHRITAQMDGNAILAGDITPVSRNSRILWRTLAVAAVTLIGLCVGIIVTHSDKPIPQAHHNSNTPIAPAIVSKPTVTAPIAHQVVNTPNRILTKPLHHYSTIPHTISLPNEIAQSQSATDKQPTANSPAPTSIETTSTLDIQSVWAQAADKSNATDGLVELGNVPLYNLNFLTKRPVNDEITVIKSISTHKKKHGKGKEDEDNTKVILMGKKYDRMPDIRYQIPVRF